MKSILRVSAAFSMALFIAWLATHDAAAQISVGVNGVGPLTFDTLPPASEWSYRTMPGLTAGITTQTVMDAQVQTNSSGSITTQLVSATSDPPTASGTGMWASSGHYVLTRPTGVAGVLLMATLRNDTGAAMYAVNVSYNLNIQSPTAEEIPGHSVYWSITGATGTWQYVTALSGISTSALLSANIVLTNWPPNSMLYLLWSDDNGSGVPDGAIEIDNFAITAAEHSPRIITQPQSQTWAPGVPVTFSVTASGTPPFFYQWLKNSNNIAGATNESFTINTALPADNGFYSVIVSNAFDSITSTDALLTVGCFAPVTITSQPQAQTLTSGNNLTLSVAASGTPPFGYQWYQGSSAISGATNSMYLKTNAAPSNSGFYHATVMNCAGTQTSSNALVSIPSAPYTMIGLTNYFWKYRNETSNIDLGTSWQGVGYDDSGWLTGRGIFAVETDAPGILALTNTILVLTEGTSSSIITHRFRTTFNFTNDPASVSLTFSNYFDDGAVVYLNSNELFRVNMPGGAIGYLSLANSVGPVTGEGTFFVTNFSGTRFAPGTNTLAVEVHQVNATSSDIDFGLAVITSFPAPTQLSITNQPLDIVAQETDSVTFSVGVAGVPAFFQWFKNGVAIPGANSPVLMLSNVSTENSGYYAVTVSNVINFAVSRLARLDVAQDFFPPALVAADLVDATHVLATFSQAVLPATATNVANYSLTNTLGQVVTITSAKITNGNSVLLTTSLLLNNANYILTASGIADTSVHHNVLSIGAVPVARSFRLIAFDSEMFFFDPYPPFDDPDPGPNWKEDAYDTSTWGLGAGAFGLMLNPSVAPVPINSALNQTPGLTTYFRFPFVSALSPSGLDLALRHAVDDGAVFYLNGREIYRFNMPAGAPSPQTPAAASIGNASLLGSFSVMPEALRAGQNLLAVELHQISNSDTDKFFAVEFVARAQSLLVGPVVVLDDPRNATVLENRPITFQVTALGANSFQWQIDGTNFPDATNTTLSFAATPLSLDGAHVRVIAARDADSVSSSNAVLHVTPDLLAPVLLSAIGSNDTMTLTFSELLSADTATNPANYLVRTTPSGPGTAMAITGVTVNESNVVLHFAALPPGSYFVFVNNVRDTSAAGNLIAPGTAFQSGYNGVLTSFGSAWSFDQRGLDNGTAWRALGYDDSAWPIGSGLFFGKNGTIPSTPFPVNTILSIFNSSSVYVVTYYFRTKFSSAAASNITLSLRPIIDDGAIFYLNGAEIFRLGMPLGPVSYGTFANRTVSVGTEGTVAIEGPFSILISNLVSGDNVLAAEVHQVSSSSGDVAFALEVTASIPGAGPVVMEMPQPILRIEPWGDQFAITWDDPSYSLEAAADPQGPWSVVAVNTASVFITPADTRAFFRLRR